MATAPSAEAALVVRVADASMSGIGKAVSPRPVDAGTVPKPAGCSTAAKVVGALFVGMAGAALVVGVPLGLVGPKSGDDATSTTVVTTSALPDWAKFYHDDHALWSYSGETGAAHWGEIRNATTGALLYPTCANSPTSRQSPIDIVPANAVVATPAVAPQTRFYNASSMRISARPGGHPGFQVIPVDGTAIWTVDGTNYSLIQFHYHSPSEHTVNGESFPLEVHFVHQAANKALAVFGILYPYSDSGKGVDPNPFISEWWDQIFTEVR
jgi:carbonic anhydrase